MAFRGLGRKLRSFGRKQNRVNDYQFLTVIIDFVMAPTRFESRRILEAHPELLSQDVDTLLAQLARAQNDEAVRAAIEDRWILLQACRARGVDSACVPMTVGREGGVVRQLHDEGGSIVGEGVSTELESLLDELQKPSTIENLSRRIQVCERALVLAPRHTNTAQWAWLQAELAYSLSRNPLGDRAGNLETAIGCYQAALQVYTREAWPAEWAATQLNLGLAYQGRVRGDRADNLEQSIGCYQAALQVFTRQAQPFEWALTQLNLGAAYRSRVRGDRADNLEQSIGCYHASLQVYTRQAQPAEWAGTQNNLGVAYQDRVRGDRADNLERSIGCYQAALQVRSREALPTDWAATQNNLGNAYQDRVRGDRADNLEQAIGCYQAALQVFVREAVPFEWALTQLNLGNTYRERVRGDRADNLEQAIDCLQAALQVRTREALPFEWARTKNGLGIAYVERVRGDRADNLEQAIDCLQAALQVLTREALPANWASTQHDLGVAYQDRVRGDRADNLEQAIDCLQAALQVRTREALPYDWAGAQHSLGAAYRSRVRGDRADNLEQSIGCYQAALQVYTREALPNDWALTQHNLSLAYQDRVRGDRANNMEQAIDCLQAALQVRTREALPIDWALTQHNLGLAHIRRVRGDRADNVEQAIGCYQAALQVRSREALPTDWAATQDALGNAYRGRVRGDRADNLEQAISCLQAALQVRTREALPNNWAYTQRSLGVAYQGRVRGDRADNLERTIGCYEAALQVHTRKALPDEWAATQHSLGVAYQGRVRGDQADNLEQAISCLQAALQVHTREALPNDWAGAQHNLGNVYLDRMRGDQADNLEEAIGCYQAALQVYTREALPAEWAACQHSLGRAYLQRAWGNQADNLERPIACLQAALQVYQSDTRPNDTRRTARILGGACSQVGRWRDAASAYRITLDATEVLYQASLLASSRQAELAESTGIAVQAAYALARVGEADEAVVILERGRARGLGDGLDRDRADLAEVARCDPEAYETYRRASERLRKLDAVQQRGGAAGNTIEADAGGATVEAGQQARRVAEEMSADEARAAVAELAVALQRIRRIPGFDTFLAQPDVDKVAAVVETNTPLAYLVCTPGGGLTLLVHHTDGMRLAVEAIWAENFAERDLNALLVRFDGEEVIGGYLPGQLGVHAWLEDALIEGLPLLGEQLTGPLATRLDELGCTGVVLVPCGDLGLLPLHAASYDRGETQRCLLDEFDVSYVPSARVLGAARSVVRALNGFGSVLAGVGNPLPHSSPLAFARVELEEVATCFSQARLLYDEAATKEALLHAARGASYVHLSCHGLYDPDEPLSSRLDLAGQQPLTLGEILADRPFADARLVVASACQTAITDFAHLPDEAIGLPAGFLSAGTPGVVGSLWQVNDVSTALLMAKFYRYHLHGDPTTGQGPMSPARALRRAQRWLASVSAGELYERFVADPRIQAALSEGVAARLPEALAAMGAARFGLDDPHAQPFAHPYHWAPFIFVGA